MEMNKISKIIEKILSAFKTHDTVFIGETHGNSDTELLENLIIERAIAECGVRHIGIETNYDDYIEKLLNKCRNGEQPDTEIPFQRTFFNWAKAVNKGNERLSDEKAEMFFYDVPYNSDADWIDLPNSAENIKVTTRFFQEREPILTEKIVQVYNKRKGKLLIIAGALHIFKRPYMFGIPSLANQLIENPDAVPYLETEKGRIEFPGLTLDDVLYRDKPLAFRLLNYIESERIYSIYISSSNTDALFELAKQNVLPIIDTSDAKGIFWKCQFWEKGTQKAIYDFMSVDEEIPVSELFDLYINVLLLKT